MNMEFQILDGYILQWMRTANALAEDIEKCKEAGMNAHLSKPIDLEKMLAAIQKLCRNFSNRLAK